MFTQSRSLPIISVLRDLISRLLSLAKPVWEFIHLELKNVRLMFLSDGTGKFIFSIKKKKKKRKKHDRLELKCIWFDS